MDKQPFVNNNGIAKPSSGNRFLTRPDEDMFMKKKCRFLESQHFFFRIFKKDFNTYLNCFPLKATHWNWPSMPWYLSGYLTVYMSKLRCPK